MRQSSPIVIHTTMTILISFNWTFFGVVELQCIEELPPWVGLNTGKH